MIAIAIFFLAVTIAIGDSNITDEKRESNTVEDEDEND